jgi:hypothetical protein
VDSRPGHEAVRTGTYERDGELLDLSLGPAAGSAYRGRLWIVCTHGRHDRCCAQDGRPVAAALAELDPDRTWECSHLGGDRFAGNVVLLPSGTYYGRVRPSDVTDLMTAADAGEVVSHLVRGRSVHTPAQQAAQHLARERAGTRDADAFQPGAARHLGRGRYEVDLGGPAGPVLAVVRSLSGTEAGPLTCAAATTAHPPGWALEALQPAPPAVVGRSPTMRRSTGEGGAR